MNSPTKPSLAMAPPDSRTEVQREHLTHQCNAGAHKAPLYEASSAMYQLGERQENWWFNVRKTWRSWGSNRPAWGYVFRYITSKMCHQFDMVSTGMAENGWISIASLFFACFVAGENDDHPVDRRFPAPMFFRAKLRTSNGQ